MSASRLYYATYYILQGHQDQDHVLMLSLYPYLIENYIEFKRFSKKVQQELGAKVNKSPRDTTTPLAKSYSIAYSAIDDYYYILHKAQTSK